MTDAQTKSFIEDCVQSKQAKLSESHLRISQDLATLRTEFKQMLDDSKAKQDTRMQGFIKDTIAANTKALATSSTAPFATKGEMLSLFDNFKKEMREMLQPLPPAPTAMQPRQQQQYSIYAAYPQYPGAYANRVHPPLLPHDTPVHSHVHKRNKETPTQQSGDPHLMHPTQHGMVAHYQAYAPSHTQPHHYATSQTVGGASVY
jgi:hypothetical protein